MSVETQMRHRGFHTYKVTRNNKVSILIVFIVLIAYQLFIIIRFKYLFVYTSFY